MRVTHAVFGAMILIPLYWPYHQGQAKHRVGAIAIEDGEGRERIVLEVSDDQPRLRFLDENGAAQLTLGIAAGVRTPSVRGETPFIQLGDPLQGPGPWIVLTTSSNDGDGAILRIAGGQGDGATHVLLSARDEGGSMSIRELGTGWSAVDRFLLTSLVGKNPTLRLQGKGSELLLSPEK